MPTLVDASQPIVVDFLEGIYIAEDRDIVWTIYQPGTTMAQIRAGTATVENITGRTYRLTVKHRDEDATNLLVINMGADLVLTTPASGVLTAHLRSAANSALGAGRFRYKLERIDSGAWGRGAGGWLVIHP